MYINLIVVLAITVMHWIADFIMQKGSWAVGKSKNWSDLLKHTLTYTNIMYLSIIVIRACEVGRGESVVWFALWFSLITFICHTITDYYTSRHTSKQYQKQNFGGDIPRKMDFFVTIGGDQVLHHVQLFLTYYILSKI